MEDPRQEIRNKVLDDWSKERNPEGGIWKTTSIEGQYLPKWLKQPYERIQTESDKSEDKISKKFEIAAEKQKNVLDKIVENLPRVPDEEQDIGRQEPEPTVINYSQGISQSSKKPKPTPQELYEAGRTC